MKKEIKNKLKKLKPLNGTIQICPYCGKVDAYEGDNHACDRDFQEYRELSQECGDKN